MKELTQEEVAGIPSFDFKSLLEHSGRKNQDVKELLNNEILDHQMGMVVDNETQYVHQLIAGEGNEGKTMGSILGEEYDNLAEAHSSIVAFEKHVHEPNIEASREMFSNAIAESHTEAKDQYLEGIISPEQVSDVSRSIAVDKILGGLVESLNESGNEYTPEELSAHVGAAVDQQMQNEKGDKLRESLFNNIEDVKMMQSAVSKPLSAHYERTTSDEINKINQETRLASALAGGLAMEETVPNFRELGSLEEVVSHFENKQTAGIEGATGQLIDAQSQEIEASHSSMKASQAEFMEKASMKEKVMAFVDGKDNLNKENYKEESKVQQQDQKSDQDKGMSR